MLPVQSLFDDIWKLRLYLVDAASYDSLEKQNIVYPYWVVSFIHKGLVEVTDGAVESVAGAGQVMIHAPNVPFGERANTPGRHLFLLVDIRNSFDVDIFRLFPVGEVVTLTEVDQYRAVFMELLEATRKEQSEFRQLQVNSLGLQLIFHVLDSWERGGRVPRKHQGKRIDERIDTVYAFLSSRLDEKITRATLSGLVHLNPNYLDKIFFEKYRMKPMQLLRELRLKKTRRMLEASDEPLTSIATTCGLGDAPYLSHQFLKRFGLNPGLYREQVRQAHANYYSNTST
jgi:AraC-like DNA-binding protein